MYTFPSRLPASRSRAYSVDIIRANRSDTIVVCYLLQRWVVGHNPSSRPPALCFLPGSAIRLSPGVESYIHQRWSVNKTCLDQLIKHTIRLTSSLSRPTQPSQADIRRRNAAFVQKAQSGRSPVKAAKKEKPSVGLWVVAGIGILLIGSSKSDYPKLVDCVANKAIPQGCTSG
jgi:hypothetical protein